MADNSTDRVVAASHSYVDSASVKKYVAEKLVPAYFPDVDVSLRSSGLLGMTSDLVGTIAEDSFNMAATLFRETFPNRAELPESIYSHAAIFQRDIGFANPSACPILLILDEKAITDEGGAEYNKDTGFYYFYIDRDTTVNIEDVPYVLDYDIVIKYAKRETAKGVDYIFTAQYNLDHSNTLSSVNDPYIKIRRNSGLIAIEVNMHQCVRDTRFEPIVTNGTINLPVIDVPFDGLLAGFDVFYRNPEDEAFTQIKPLLVHAQALSTPFCYYQRFDDNVVRFSFNGDDAFFVPQFNSELKIVLYMTNGKSANFDIYTGENINIVPDTSVHDYDFTFILGARPLGSSYGGTDTPSIDAVKALTVEGYRTAEALTTDADLNQFFANYKYRYGEAFIRFIKRRNDIVERIFGAFILMQRGDYIYKTNTLDIEMNISDMENPDKDIYLIEPGTLFVYKGDSLNTLTFLRDADKTTQYLAEYNQALKDGTIPFVEDPPADGVPDYLNRPASFAEFKRRKGYVDRLVAFNVDQDYIRELEETHGYIFINPFMIRVKKNPNIVSLYRTCINETSVMDFTNQNDSMQVQFVLHEAKLERSLLTYNNYTITTTVMPTVTVSDDYPIIKVYGNKKEVWKNDLRVLFVVYDGPHAACFTEMTPISSENGVIRYQCTMNTNNYITSDSVLCMSSETIYVEPNVYLNSTTGEFYKEEPDNAGYYHRYSEDGTRISDEAVEQSAVQVLTNFQKYSNSGDYFVVDESNPTRYFHYHSDGTPFVGSDGVILSVPVDDITAKKARLLVYEYSNSVQMDGKPMIQIPMENVVCKIYTLYNRRYNADQSALVEIGKDGTENIFAQFTQKNTSGEVLDIYHDYTGYVWTNEYTYLSEPFTFIKPLNYVRGTMFFEDYTKTTTVEQEDGSTIEVYNNQIMDLVMKTLPFVKWDMVYNEDSMAYFMNSFAAQYDAIHTVVNDKLRNETGMDVKFYNTYGRSLTYGLSNGVRTDVLDKVNLKIMFDVWFVPGTDTFTAVPEVQRYIKEQIETLNIKGVNELHISNLIRKMEIQFPYIDHIRFKGINKYSSDYQSIYAIHSDLDEMDKDSRRDYVPEMMVVDLEDIVINDTLID